MPTAAHLSAHSSANSLASATRLWVAALFFSGSISAAGLNDTGFTTCADAAGATVSCTAATAVQGQDARYGRDAAAGTSALTKVGGGANGFDFTKISNAGAVLPATAPLGTAAGEWGCTYDNTTGLMWEVKRIDGGLRDWSHIYSWYNPNAATNGGILGVESGGACFGAARCDTSKFVQDVNATNMCGRGDWRLPTIRELFTLVKLGTSPTIDSGYFPNTATVFSTQSSQFFVYYWTSTPAISTYILTIGFSNGNHSRNSPDSADYYGRKVIRLVRAGL